MISSIIQALFKIKIQPHMSEQEKKCQRIYDLFNTEQKNKVSLSPVIKAKKKFIEKEIEQKMKRRLFKCSH